MASPRSFMTESELEKYNFELVGEIRFCDDAKLIKYSVEKRMDLIDKLGCVYAWALSNPVRNPKLQIAYVGSTHQGIYHRRSTWQSGLNSGCRKRKNGEEDGNQKGRAFQIRKKIISEIQSGSTILVWLRIADNIEIFDQIVSLAKVEEDAFILKFEPRWNWHGIGSRYNDDGIIV